MISFSKKRFAVRAKEYIHHKYIGGVLLAAGLSMVASSCEDFLTITPTSSIVEEDFWEDKSDLESVVYACYKRLIVSDVMNKFIYWGELRGDNFELNTGFTSDNITNLMNANLLSTNSMFSWTVIYNDINYCNKVLAHGEEVVEKDESFSTGDWEPIRAEMIALRAFCHYLLVRTFGEIPYVTVEYNNDGQDLELAQSTQIEVLDSIILDLESIKDVAMTDYGTTVDNKGRITRKAVYAMLADVYLWRASYKAGNSSIESLDGSSAEDDYQSCIECCEWVIDDLIADYEEDMSTSGQSLGTSESLDLSDLFISNIESTSVLRTTTTGAYDNIFGSGNSRESIFELQIDGTYNTNDCFDGLFYDVSAGTAEELVCANGTFGGIDDNPNTESPTYVFTCTDYRRWETILYTSSDQTTFPLAKYTCTSIEQSLSQTVMNDDGATVTNTIPSYNASNWIVYRLSDVVLMKAEAMSQLYSDEENLYKAFWLVREVFKRSNPYAYESRATSTDSLDFDVFNSQEGMEALVMAERQREFVGEGKRWFDLVRYAQRHGGTAEMLEMLTRKYGDTSSAIEAKLASLESLFSPIYTDELKYNSLLHQNSVWNDSESTSKTDDL